MSVGKLIAGLTTEEEVLHTVAPDPTPRDRAVWEASRIFHASWRPRLNPAATTNHEFLYLQESEVKALMKRLVLKFMDIEGESAIKDIVEVIVQESESPEQMIFGLVSLTDMAMEANKSNTNE